jgi:AcrR family transcriptional regulator
MRTDGRRAASTAATRQAIIDAARKMLVTRPWRQFTLDAVAHEAGVTRVTVYNQVSSKQGLLEVVLADVTERAGMDQLLTDSRDLKGADARGFVVRQTCRFWQAERDLLRVLFALAVMDPDIRTHLAQREQWRRDQLERLMQRLAEETPASTQRDDVPTVLAAVAAVTSFPMYDALGPPGRRSRPRRRRHRSTGGGADRMNHPVRTNGSGVADPQLLDPVDPARAQPPRFGQLGDVGHVVRDRVEDQVDLQPGQVRADAVMRARAAKAEVRVRGLG